MRNNTIINYKIIFLNFLWGRTHITYHKIRREGSGKCHKIDLLLGIYNKGWSI